MTLHFFKKIFSFNLIREFQVQYMLNNDKWQWSDMKLEPLSSPLWFDWFLWSKIQYMNYKYKLCLYLYQANVVQI